MDEIEYQCPECGRILDECWGTDPQTGLEELTFQCAGHDCLSCFEADEIMNRWRQNMATDDLKARLREVVACGYMPAATRVALDQAFGAIVTMENHRGMEWQPIETAPKDARILVWCASYGEVYLASWVEYPTGHWQPEYAEVSMMDEEDDRATHWMPLPSPPA